MEIPVVSIAMAARNAEPYIAEALDSISGALEDQVSFEVLLADGGSTDKTVEIALSRPAVRLVSRKDLGIYDGMNRAIAAAQGEYVLILNSDDTLFPRVLGRALSELAIRPDYDMASSSAAFGRSVDDIIVRHHKGGLTLEGAFFGVPAINARIFRRSLLQRMGPFRTDIGLGADREYLIRLAQAGTKGLAVPDPIYFYRSHPGSETMANDASGRQRVYSADTIIASLYLQEASAGEETQRHARQLRALCNMKLKVSGMLTLPQPAQISGSRIDLLGGLLAVRKALKWRGRLSGT